jgi:hypothetical protein
MIVHRLLDAVFRTLDTVDAIRARVDAALTREAQPPSSWPAVIGAARSERTSFDVDTARDIYATTTVDTWRGDSSHDENATPSDAPVVPSTTTTTTPTKTSDAHGAPAQVATKATKASTKASTKAPTKASTTKTGKTGKATKKTAAKATADTRKGSVDRVGKDLDSVRATEIAGWLATHPQPVVTEAAAIDGKRTVARLVWAVSVAQQAGHTDGLTAADASALLSSIAHVEVFATNVARAFRDEQALFVETSVDGRSKRYALTAAGKKRLADVEVA